MYQPTEQQKVLIQSAYDKRSTDWHPNKWDYTEWEEFSCEISHICEVAQFTIIDTSFLVTAEE